MFVTFVCASERVCVCVCMCERESERDCVSVRGWVFGVVVFVPFVCA